MTRPPDFDLFAGIDWSGAKGNVNRGIQVALAEPDRGQPRLLANPYRQNGIWSRPDILRWLLQQAESGIRTFAGFDFAFSYPFEDEGAYFPGLAQTVSPPGPRQLWALVEELAAETPDLYGAAMYQREDLPYRDYYLAPRWRGPLYKYRQRLTEHAAAPVTVPHPVLKCIGAANVGTGSLAGMRLLHRLQGGGDDFRIWPFDKTPGGLLTVAEIFPRLYYRLAEADPRAWSERENLARVFDAFGTAGGTIAEVRTEDEADALVSAVAIRALCLRPDLWRQALRPGAAREGWIFGAA